MQRRVYSRMLHSEGNGDWIEEGDGGYLDEGEGCNLEEGDSVRDGARFKNKLMGVMVNF